MHACKRSPDQQCHCKRAPPPPHLLITVSSSSACLAKQPGCHDGLHGCIPAQLHLTPLDSHFTALSPTRRSGPSQGSSGLPGSGSLRWAREAVASFRFFPPALAALAWGSVGGTAATPRAAAAAHGAQEEGPGPFELLESGQIQGQIQSQSLMGSPAQPQPVRAHGVSSGGNTPAVSSSLPGIPSWAGVEPAARASASSAQPQEDQLQDPEQQQDPQQQPQRRSSVGGALAQLQAALTRSSSKEGPRSQTILRTPSDRLSGGGGGPSGPPSHPGALQYKSAVQDGQLVTATGADQKGKARQHGMGHSRSLKEGGQTVLQHLEAARRPAKGPGSGRVLVFSGLRWVVPALLWV